MAGDPSGENFVLTVDHKVKATQGKGLACHSMSMQDFLGEIYIHNADQVGIQVDSFVGVIKFNDGRTHHLIPNSEFSYVKNGDKKLVLKVNQQLEGPAKAGDPSTPICLGNIKEFRILKDPLAVPELLE